MNFAFLSGIITNIQDMTENIKMARLEDEKQVYLLYWENKNFLNEDLLNKHIQVITNIEKLKIRNEKNKVKIVTAYKVKEMELVDDI